MPLKGKTIRLSDRGHEVLALLAGIYGTEGRAAEIAFEHLYQQVTFTPEVSTSTESKPLEQEQNAEAYKAADPEPHAFEPASDDMMQGVNLNTRKAIRKHTGRTIRQKGDGTR